MAGKKRKEKEDKNGGAGNFADALESKIKSLKGPELPGSDLTVLEREVLDAFWKERLLPLRVYIIVNEGREQMGRPLIKKEELEEILQSLVKKGYLKEDHFEYEGEKRVAYVLTEKGKETVAL